MKAKAQKCRRVPALKRLLAERAARDPLQHPDRRAPAKQGEQDGLRNIQHTYGEASEEKNSTGGQRCGGQGFRLQPYVVCGLVEMTT